MQTQRERQRVIVRTLQGSCGCDYDRDGWVTDAYFHGSDREAALLSELSSLRSLTLGPCKVTPEGMLPLAQVASLRALKMERDTNFRGEHLRYFVHTPIEEASVCLREGVQEGLAHLGGMQSLERLELQGMPIEAGWLKPLSSLRQLRALDMSTSTVNEQAVTDLGGLPTLRKLSLGLGIRKGLVHLRSLTNLESITIEHFCTTTRRLKSPISDEDLSGFVGCRNLLSVCLRGAFIVGPGLVHLGACPKLESLWLSGTKVDDRILEIVESLPASIRDLDVSRTRITRRGLWKLRSALPSCCISAFHIEEPEV